MLILSTVLTFAWQENSSCRRDKNYHVTAYLRGFANVVDVIALKITTFRAQKIYLIFVSLDIDQNVKFHIRAVHIN